MLAIAIGRVLSTVIAVLMNIKPCSRIIGYTYKMQISDLMPYMVSAGLMGAVVWWLASVMTLPSLSQILILAPMGGLLYVVLLWIMKADSFVYAINLVRCRI